MSVTINNTNGYQTRAYHTEFRGSVHRIFKYFSLLVDQYIYYRNIRNVKQCIKAKKIFIIVNANIGSLLHHNILPQNIYTAAKFIQKDLPAIYGENHKTTKHAVHHAKIFCEIYENTCISGTQMPVEIFRIICSYI